MWGMINPGGDQPPVFNRLAAHEIRTGKLAWELGGPAGPHALRQPETFFLGPPLVLMGQLYVLAENGGEMRLMALEAATGNVLWSQQLSLAEQADPQHRWMGVSPSYADGVLVCPTATGAVVAVELATRSLLWGYCYSQENEAGNRGIAQGFMGAAGSRWADGSASVRDGRVIITPPESDFLYCLSLINGTFLWKCPRKTPATTTSTWLVSTGTKWCWSAATPCGPCSFPTASRPGAGARSPCPSTAPRAAAASRTATATSSP